jgi:hypothetical protein
MNWYNDRKELWKEIIMNISKQLGFELSNPDKVMSRHDYNKYVFKYDSLYSK